MEISLAGKVALVTGAGPNIGSGIALALARYGATVACNDIDPDAAAAAVARIERNDGRAIAVPGDVTDPEQVTGYIGRIVDELGGIDILVNNAALLGGRGVLDESAEFFDRAVRVAALGSFLNTQQVGRHMAERGTRGSIVNVSSSNGWSGSAGVIAYAFHKGGINNFTRAAAMDLAPYGIRVNSFTPTAPTPDNPALDGRSVLDRPRPGRGIGGEAGTESWRRPARWSGDRIPMVPMGSTGTPTDIGHCVAWMCSDQARLITGQDFVVDGGARAKNFAYAPAAATELAGPVPLVGLDVTGELDREPV
ncbi:SDR family NAD(P)-dependent oxidoreductase [Pseudonocardia nematodicida]|uniref:SDR family NAD(P)-dependent oxidoreductase n=1 Tax=Pseudonocardia nematodicida TaxID=1206997 RepID=A0ABV1K6T8_9PSEU